MILKMWINMRGRRCAAADVPFLFAGMGPGGSPSIPTTSTLAMPSPRPLAPMTVSSRAYPVMPTACPSPTAACKSPLPGQM